VTETQILIGSLSNDLFRVANSTQRGSTQAAVRFVQESKRWATPLQRKKVAKYIKKIAQEISSRKDGTVSMQEAERYLVYGILLQNYALHHSK